MFSVDHLIRKSVIRKNIMTINTLGRRLDETGRIYVAIYSTCISVGLEHPNSAEKIEIVAWCSDSVFLHCRALHGLPQLLFALCAAVWQARWYSPLLMGIFPNFEGVYSCGRSVAFQKKGEECACTALKGAQDVQVHVHPWLWPHSHRKWYASIRFHPCFSPRFSVWELCWERCYSWTLI